MDKSENWKIWEQRIEAQLTSELTQRQWCDENNLALTAFRYWKQQIIKEKNTTTSKAQRTEERLDFAGIVIAPEGSDKHVDCEIAGAIEIRFGDMVLVIPPKFSETHLTNIIRTLRKS